MPMNVPQPKTDESESDFIVRAHRELMPFVPEPMQRNQVVWDAWSAIHGNIERERAERLFNGERYEHKRDVCLWHEHEAQSIGADGQPVVKHNDVNRLRGIVHENNLRIADTDAYTALVDKHTLGPGEDDKNKDKPKTIGFVGPFRLGMIGRVQPRFAIFGDEHHRRDRAEILADRPRRSVEVLTLRANGRSYLDPIAALSEAPRLPLPVNYSAQTADGQACIVDRYQAEPVAAFPGGGNTYIPGNGKPRRNPEQFDASSNDAPDPSTESAPMLGPEDLKQIADAIMSTPQMQFVQQLMQQNGGQSPAAPPASPPQQPAGGQREPYANPMGAMPGVANMFSANESEEYEIDNDAQPDGVDNERYSALVESQGQLMERYSELATRNAALEARAADADRKVRLGELAQQFPHMVDLDVEHRRCLYSAGSEMNDMAFDTHCEMVEQYAARVPAVTQMVPGGELPARQNSDAVKTERYQAAVSKRSSEIYTAALSTGKVMTADECWEEAEKEIDSAA